mmetsp:Transcript_8734/g.25919  ORF Transcript_8734/g.25919 Transcript_8734/m.25919 type:complete len:204 (-) Transcript_8734:808-1419(-)
MTNLKATAVSITVTAMLSISAVSSTETTKMVAGMSEMKPIGTATLTRTKLARRHAQARMFIAGNWAVLHAPTVVSSCDSVGLRSHTSEKANVVTCMKGRRLQRRAGERVCGCRDRMREGESGVVTSMPRTAEGGQDSSTGTGPFLAQLKHIVTVRSCASKGKACNSNRSKNSPSTRWIRWRSFPTTATLDSSTCKSCPFGKSS